MNQGDKVTYRNKIENLTDDYLEEGKEYTVKIFNKKDKTVKLEGFKFLHPIKNFITKEKKKS